MWLKVIAKIIVCGAGIWILGMDCFSTNWKAIRTILSNNWINPRHSQKQAVFNKDFNNKSIPFQLIGKKWKLKIIICKHQPNQSTPKQSKKWKLGSGTWDLETEIWSLGFRIWGSDIWHLGFEIWDLRCVMCDLGSESANERKKANKQELEFTV